MKSFQIRILNGDLRGKKFLLPDDCSAIVGRSKDCDVQIIDRLVSRNHFRIEPSSTRGHLLHDIGSQHGTRVNKIPTQSSVLCIGDLIHVGTTVMIYEAVPAKRPWHFFGRQTMSTLLNTGCAAELLLLSTIGNMV